MSKNVIFADTEEFDQKDAPGISAVINKTLNQLGLQGVAIGSAHTPVPGNRSGDLDLQVELSDIIKKFGVTPDPDVKKDTVESAARRALATRLQEIGYETKRAGVNVFVRVPYQGKHYQVDLECIYKVSKVSRYHQHKIPKGSPYKGVGKQLMIASLAKQMGYVYSAWEGLYARTPENKKGELVADDWDEMAKVLLGPTATGDDLDSVESIMNALPPDQAQALLAHVKQDKNWVERPPVQESKFVDFGRTPRLKETRALNKMLSIAGLR
jgi:hypothetical protein